MSNQYPKCLYRDGASFDWEGRSLDGIVVDDAQAEADARKLGYGPIGEVDSKGPLDGSVKALTEYLAGENDASIVRKLIADEKAGKTRAGAIAALEARLDEIT